MLFRTSVESEPSAFRPDTIALLAAALEDTLHQLGLLDRNDPNVTKIAKKIIELARLGERDPLRLRDRAIESLQSQECERAPARYAAEEGWRHADEALGLEEPNSDAITRRRDDRLS